MNWETLTFLVDMVAYLFAICIYDKRAQATIDCNGLYQEL